MTAAELHKELLTYIDPQKVDLLPRFFKTGPGQYGEGDKFLGVTVPNTHKVAKLGKDLSMSEIENLLHSSWHEDRLLALIILVNQFKKADQVGQKIIYDFYLANTSHINNWDLVDTSASNIVGAYLYIVLRSTKPLQYLASSDLLWERRIAMIATLYFIVQGSSKECIEIATILIDDTHDLMHKAVGWMLREMGKRVSADELREFLEIHAATMPRTTLRYAIEHFSPEERKKWLAKRAESGVLLKHKQLSTTSGIL